MKNSKSSVLIKAILKGALLGVTIPAIILAIQYLWFDFTWFGCYKLFLGFLVSISMFTLYEIVIALMQRATIINSDNL